MIEARFRHSSTEGAFPTSDAVYTLLRPASMSMVHRLANSSGLRATNTCPRPGIYWAWK